MKLKWGLQCGPQSSVTGVLIKRGVETSAVPAHRGRTMRGHGGSHPRPTRGASEENRPATSLFKPPELWQKWLSVALCYGSPSRLIAIFEHSARLVQFSYSSGRVIYLRSHFQSSFYRAILSSAPVGALYTEKHHRETKRNRRAPAGLLAVPAALHIPSLTEMPARKQEADTCLRHYWS